MTEEARNAGPELKVPYFSDLQATFQRASRAPKSQGARPKTGAPHPFFRLLLVDVRAAHKEGPPVGLFLPHFVHHLFPIDQPELPLRS